MGLLCYFCHHPFTQLPILTPDKSSMQIQCGICKADFRVEMTVVNRSPLSGEELQARQNQPV